MKTLKLLFTFLILIASISSCKKCYICTCTDPGTTFGCTVPGEKLEICDKGLVGKSILSARVLEKETEGYTCTLK
jgi:hypothetical protein